jgi:lysozyme family protein
MTTKQIAPRAQRGGGAHTAFDRQALIDQLTRSDGGLEDILVKSPRDLTEAEIRQIAERRLALPAGTEKETLDRFERAFYDDAYGADPADADETGRLMAPAARRAVNAAPVPARTVDGMDLSRAVGRLAERVADVAETQGSRDAVRFLQRGLTMLSQALTASQGAGTDRSPTPGPMFQDLRDDGDPGPKTRAALRMAAARLGSAKIEEALALGRFEAALRGMADGALVGNLRKATSAAFAELFRDPAAVGLHIPTEEGESLQMSVNDLGKVLLGPRGFTALREDGIIGPKTEAALKRVLKAAGPRRLTETMGRNLGFFLFESPKPGRRSLLQSAAGVSSGQNFDII